MFQFHIGSIKSLTGRHDPIDRCRFNSILVQLKGGRRRHQRDRARLVSIPYWFN